MSEFGLDELFETDYYEISRDFIAGIVKRMEEKLIQCKPEDPALAYKVASLRGARVVLTELETEKRRHTNERAK